MNEVLIKREQPTCMHLISEMSGCMKTFVFLHDLKEMNDICLENKTQSLYKSGKNFIRFTDID